MPTKSGLARVDERSKKLVGLLKGVPATPFMFPMAVHNLFDIAAGALLVASPWIFGFADEGTNVWAPFVVVGIAAIGLGLTTKQSGGYSYRRTTPVAG